jgi:transcriptional regulator with XRE-family HTH domain
MGDSQLAQIFAYNIQQKRRLLGLTQDALAEKLGIGQQSLSRMERGIIAPKFERLSDIASVLHCSVAELFVNDSMPENSESIIIADILQGLTREERRALLHFILDAAHVFKTVRS